MKLRSSKFNRLCLGALGCSLWALNSFLCGLAAAPAERNWPVYLGDRGSTHYSLLKQITPRNVRQLEVAWVYHSGDARADNLSQIQCNPLIIDGILYGTTPRLKLIALDAATGHELWRFDPFESRPSSDALGVNRGVVYWADGTDRRILFSADHFLYAVDAATGRSIEGFGDKGHVDIKDGLGRDVSNLYVVSTSPGAVYRNLLFLPLRVGEGPAPAAPGHLRAYDIRTGKIVWTFHILPYPGEPGYNTWPPDAWTYVGGVNCWTGMSVDERRGIVYVPTGSAAFDFWGGNRIGQDLFANCLLALDANTGRRIWHFQCVHHDLWDRDLPAPPVLVTVRHNGHPIDAVAQTTKSGHVFLFNRDTGEPLFPIKERMVPPSDLQGEAAWPTQPLPTKPLPFARQFFTYNEITDISPASRREVLDRFSKIRPHVPFAPPSTEGTIIFPGFDGGGEWGGAAVDPDGVLYVNENEMPWILTMVPIALSTNGPSGGGHQLFTQICAACHGVERKGNAAQNVPSLVEIGKKMKRADIVHLLATGRGMMPSFNFLSNRQKEALADVLLGTTTPAAGAERHEEVSGDVVLGGIPYTMTGYNRWLDTNGYPAVKPPWGTLNAIDLNTGEYRWRVTLGEIPALTARGIAPTGLENYGGPIVTAGGLLFIAAAKDEMIRSFDQRTGKTLWQAKLPANGFATPSTYMVNGRQFVVIACGGGKVGTKSGDAYVAFALPGRK
ncbi:MAG TPA: PQQ-binding-like beta-propeller repeat protein [Verrucomicrobiae bacterium]|nr:PQQ-binding-like beta-propeller repeat protein [Verrucomicrobiae bacterium]